MWLVYHNVSRDRHLGILYPNENGMQYERNDLDIRRQAVDQKQRHRKEKS